MSVRYNLVKMSSIHGSWNWLLSFWCSRFRNYDYAKPDGKVEVAALESALEYFMQIKRLMIQ